MLLSHDLRYQTVPEPSISAVLMQLDLMQLQIGYLDHDVGGDSFCITADFDVYIFAPPRCSILYQQAKKSLFMSAQNK